MRKKILITGSTGFIGQHVIRAMKAAGYIVTGISFDQLDLCQAQKVASFFQRKDFDIIIHLAARVPKTDSEAEQRLALQENISSTLNVLEEFRKSKAEKFIYTSGISVIAQRNSLYVLSKYFGEILCQYYQEKFHKKITILRISAPYGPGQATNNVIPIFIEKALKNQDIPIFGTGKRSQDFIYIDDVARAFLAAVKSDKSGIYNVGSGRPTTTLKLAKVILKSLPESHSKIVFSGKDPQENYRLKMDISKAKKELQFRPKIMIEEGIGEFLRSLVAQR